jgi:hypothetical protein
MVTVQRVLLTPLCYHLRVPVGTFNSVANSGQIFRPDRIKSWPIADNRLPPRSNFLKGRSDRHEKNKVIEKRVALFGKFDKNSAGDFSGLIQFYEVIVVFYGHNPVSWQHSPASRNCRPKYYLNDTTWELIRRLFYLNLHFYDPTFLLYANVS